MLKHEENLGKQSSRLPWKRRHRGQLHIFWIILWITHYLFYKYKALGTEPINSLIRDSILVSLN